MATAKFRQRSSYINHSILFFMALTIILPLLVLIFNSIKPVEEFGSNPLGFPSEIRLMNYYDAWVNGNYTQIFFNSITLVVGTLILNLTVSGLAAFSLAALNPRVFKQLLLVYIFWLELVYPHNYIFYHYFLCGKACIFWTQGLG